MQIQKNKVFLRSLWLNMVIVLMMLFGLLVLSMEMRSTMRKSELQNITVSLEKGMQQLSHQITNVCQSVTEMHEMMHLSDLMNQEQYNAVLMRETSDQLSRIVSSNQMVSQIALVYEEQDYVITSNLVFPSIRRFLSYYQISGMDSDIFYHYVGETGKLAATQFFPCTSIKPMYGGKTDIAFCYAIPLDSLNFSARQGIAYVFFDRDVLFYTAVPSSLQKYTSLALYDNRNKEDKRLLAAYESEYEDEGFETSIVSKNEIMLCTAEISNEYLDDALKTVNHYIFILMAVSVLTGFAAAFWAAYRQNLPMLHVIRHLRDSGLLISTDSNEYIELMKSVDNLLSEKESDSSRLNAYQVQLQNNMLDRLFTSTTLNPEVEQVLRVEIEKFPENALVYYGKVLITAAENSHSIDLTMMMLLEYLRQHLPSNAILHSTDTVTFGLLYPVTGSPREAEEEFSELLAEIPNHFAAQVVAVSGGCSSSIGTVGICFERAQLNYYSSIDCRESWQYLLRSEENLPAEEGLRLRSLQNMYQYMMTGDSENAVAALETFFVCPTDTLLVDIRERYYALKVQILLACREIAPNREPPVIPPFRMADGAEKQLLLLSGALRTVCGYAAELQDSEKDDQASVLIAYLKDHYSDPSLCATSLADEFRVSERYLFSLFKAKTGYSPISFLHHIRMEKAVELLRDTDLTVQKISEQIGFSNFGTFHKAFKRDYGVAPGKYREIMLSGGGK